jgi:hypothetical protein
VAHDTPLVPLEKRGRGKYPCGVERDTTGPRPAPR